jgi:shikimate kinase
MTEAPAPRPFGGDPFAGLQVGQPPGQPSSLAHLRGKGEARCHGAITVVNAIPTGRGAAVGIALEAEAEVRLNPTGHLIIDIVSEEREPTALVRSCIQRAFQAANCGDLGAWVTTRAQMPAARGLKSSSAVANAVVLAALDAVGAAENRDDDEVIRMGVDAAIMAGVTITGAFDDASACYRGGLVITDNGARELLHRSEVDEAMVAVLHVPQQRLPKSGFAGVPWTKAAEASQEALRLVEAGKWMEALRVNGEAIAALLALDQAPAKAAIAAGALTAGLSGTGPSTAAVCASPKEAKKVAKALAKLKTGAVLQAHLSNASAQVVRRP